MGVGTAVESLCACGLSEEQVLAANRKLSLYKHTRFVFGKYELEFINGE